MNDQDGERAADDNDTSGEQGSAPSAPLLPRHIHRGWWIALVGAGVVMLTVYADNNLGEYLFEPETYPSHQGPWARAQPYCYCCPCVRSSAIWSINEAQWLWWPPSCFLAG